MILNVYRIKSYSWNKIKEYLLNSISLFLYKKQIIKIFTKYNGYVLNISIISESDLIATSSKNEPIFFDIC